jgi:short-subunit dehydrogenase
LTSSSSYLALAILTPWKGWDVHAVDVKLGDKIKSLGCAASQLDVSSPQAIEQFADKLKDKEIDLLLNIAGSMLSPKDEFVC